MTLKDIFEKPVDRNIEGVIKADENQSLKLEVDQYVLTNEVSKRLDIFLMLQGFEYILSCAHIELSRIRQIRIFICS